MSFSEVKQLRQNGKLNEAYAMAKEEYDNDPDDIWNVRSLAWVYYDILKKRAEGKDLTAFIQGINMLNELQVPDDEEMFWDNVCWPIRTMAQNVDGEVHDLEQLFTVIQQLNLPACNAKSIMFLPFLEVDEQWDSFLQFCEWWNLESFTDEDYKGYVMPNGRKLPSLVERVYYAYAKKIIAFDDLQRAEAVIPKLQQLMKEHHYTFLPYYLCKLKLMLGQRKEAFEVILPFVKKKSSEFWTWQMMGDATDDAELRFSCYCKALECKAKDEMTIALRVEFAQILIERKMLAEAKCECQIVEKICHRNKWRVSKELYGLLQQSWYNTTDATKDNRQLYADNKALAENKVGVKVAKVMQNTNTTKETITGQFKAVTNKDFGFLIKDKLRAFVPPSLASQMVNGQTYTGDVVSSFDKKNNCMGWKLVNIKKP